MAGRRSPALRGRCRGDRRRRGPGVRERRIDLEIEIKRAKGALKAPDDVVEQVEAAGFAPLAISQAHAREAGRLPRHHDDPFDRMLVAQAIAAQATLITSDEAIPRYSVDVLSAS